MAMMRELRAELAEQCVALRAQMERLGEEREGEPTVRWTWTRGGPATQQSSKSMGKSWEERREGSKEQ